MPVTGPIALIVLRSGLRGDFQKAMRVVFGAAIAETMYCALATFGYVQIIQAFPFLTKYVRYISAVFLLVLGIVFLFQKVSINEDNLSAQNSKAAGFVSGFLIALFNPTLFVTWGSASSTVFSWMSRVTIFDMVLFPLGAGVGIVVWFFILLEIFKKFRERIGETIGRYAIRGAAVVMLVSGIFLLFQAGK